LLLSLVIFACLHHLRALHSFPTRRSSDSEHIFALSSPESTRAQARATLSDLNGHTMRITTRALHARIAIRSGLMPTMFMARVRLDRKSTRLNSSHSQISYAVFCLKKKKI